MGRAHPGRATALRAHPMNYRRLGDSDLEVSEISLGSWLTYSGGVEREQPRPAPRPPSRPASTSSTPPTSTAPAPPRRPGARSSPATTRDSYVLATKVYFPMSETDRGLSARADPQADRRLAGAPADRPRRPLPVPPLRRETPIEETMEALSEVVGRGKARYIGFCEWTPEQIRAASRCRARRSSSPPSRSTTCSGARPRRRSSRSARSTGSRRSSGRRWPRAC